MDPLTHAHLAASIDNTRRILSSDKNGPVSGMEGTLGPAQCGWSLADGQATCVTSDQCRPFVCVFFSIQEPSLNGTIYKLNLTVISCGEVKVIKL